MTVRWRQFSCEKQLCTIFAHASTTKARVTLGFKTNKSFWKDVPIWTMQLAEEDRHFILRWFFDNFLIKGIDQELPYLPVKIPEESQVTETCPSVRMKSQPYRALGNCRGKNKELCFSDPRQKAQWVIVSRKWS